MKIKIQYEYMPEHDQSFWAESEILKSGESIIISTCGNSWAEARSRHIDKLQRFAAHQAVNLPKSEEIEV